MAAVPNNDHEAVPEDRMRSFVCCACCRLPIAYDCNFVRDLYPFSMTYLLYDHCNGVSPFSPALITTYVGEPPKGSEVDIVAIKCNSCRNRVGWIIMSAKDRNHPEICPHRFILVKTHNAVGGVEFVFFR